MLLFYVYSDKKHNLAEEASPSKRLFFKINSLEKVKRFFNLFFYKNK